MRLVQGQMGSVLQITPIALTKAVTDPDTAAAKCAFDAMMQMKKSTSLQSRRRAAKALLGLITGGSIGHAKEERERVTAVS